MIPYQSSIETDLINWYRNLMLRNYDFVPSFYLRNLKNVQYSNLHSFINCLAIKIT